MKKILSCLSLALCVLFSAVFLAACGNDIKWLQPNYTFEGDKLSFKFVDNTKEDFEFPIEGQKLDHSKFASERLLEYRFVLYDREDEIVGWIEADGGYDYNKNGSYKYGFSTTYVNGVYGYCNANICVILKSKDLTIFDRLEITSDYGSVEMVTTLDENPMPATQRYSHYDEETNQTLPDAGAENFVCCHYTLNIESIDPSATRTINITFSLKTE